MILKAKLSAEGLSSSPAIHWSLKLLCRCWGGVNLTGEAEDTACSGLLGSVGNASGCEIHVYCIFIFPLVDD